MVKPQLLLGQTNLNRFRLGTLMHETNSASFTSPWDTRQVQKSWDVYRVTLTPMAKGRCMDLRAIADQGRDFFGQIHKSLQLT